MVELVNEKLLKVELKNEAALRRKFTSALSKAKDLTVAFTLIQRQEFKLQRTTFQLRSRGKYIDLKPKYKARKKEKIGSAYPILFYSGRLSASLTNPGGENISIITPRSLTFGTRVPYGIFHQSREGRRRVPYRPFLIIDEQRLRNYSNILKAHILKPFSQGVTNGS